MASKHQLRRELVGRVAECVTAKQHRLLFKSGTMTEILEVVARGGVLWMKSGDVTQVVVITR